MARGTAPVDAELGSLRESLAFFRAMVDHSLHWEYWLGPGREILYMSLSCERITGHTRAEFLADPSLLAGIIHADDRPQFLEHLGACGDEEGVALEFRIVRRDSAVCWIRHSCQPVRDDDGKLLGRRVSNHDITGQKRAEEALRFQAMVLDQTADIVTATDLEGNITYVNEGQAALLGYSKSELIGRSVTSYGDSAAQTEIIAATLAHGEWRGEVMNRDSQGRESIVFCRTRVMRDSQGQPIGMCGSATDITERRRLENRQTLMVQIARRLNEPGELSEVSRDVLLLLKEHTGIEAVGLRIRDEDDYPYLESCGFDPGFVEKERSLCSRDEDGEILRETSGRSCLDCMCGNVIRGRTNPEFPFFSEGGSFWTNSTSDLLASTTEEDRQARTRNRCNRAGYESVTLIPLRSGTEILGLLQLNDRRKDQFTPELIQFLEGVATSVGIAVARNQMHKALSLANAYNRRLIETSLDPLVTIGSDGKISDVNTATERATGYSRQELLGADFSSYFTEPEKARIGYQLVFRHGHLRDYELELRHRDGRLTPVLCNAAVYRDESNQIIGVFAAARDVTQMRQLEEKNRRLAAIVQSSDDAIIGNDIDGIVTSWNPGASRIFGYDESEMIGNPVRLLAPERFHDEVRQLLNRVEHGEHINHYETTRRTKDGTCIEVSLTISPIKNAEGRVVGASAIARDITDRTRAAAEREKLQSQLLQAQKMEAVGRLAGGVAHDFNNMLALISGYAELAMGQLGAGHPARADLEEVCEAARRSTDVTRQLLAFARKQITLPRVLDLNETVEGMLKMLRRLIGEDVELAWTSAAQLWPIYMDPSQIDQILANLCVNARDAISGVGKVTVETAVHSFDEAYSSVHANCVPGDYVLLAVSDNGCGMDAETLSNIFEPFFTTKEPGKGTGLGLATVYGVVRQNHGFINVYSEPGQGTTFQICLPRYTGEAEPADDGNVAPAVAMGHETILVVEDEQGILNLSRRILEECGYSVFTAAAPTGALRLAEKLAGKIDLLLTDVIMPEMNGPDLARRLRSLYPNLKCLFMSGYTADAIARHGVLEVGVNFIHKPFSKTDLAAKIRAALDRA